jgi:energy-converting hydrogenase Eha subunit H
MKPLGYIVLFLLFYLIIFGIARIITVIKYKRKGLEKEISVPVKYIENRFKLKLGETKKKKVRLMIDIINALAFSVPIYIEAFFDLKMSMITEYAMLVGIFSCIVLGGYTILGKVLKRKDEE